MTPDRVTATIDMAFKRAKLPLTVPQLGSEMTVTFTADDLYKFAYQVRSLAIQDCERYIKDGERR